MKRTTARTAAAIIAMAGLALLSPACSSAPGSHVAQVGSNTTQKSSTPPAAPAQQNGALAFSHCMRSNGVPNFPDPNNSGVFSKVTLSQLAANNSRYQAAQRACQHLLPTASVEQQRLDASRALRFSQCIRNHGITNFPDPAGNGRIPDPASFGIDQGAAQFQAANQACRAYRPPYLPSNAAYDAWARTQGS